SIPHGTRPPPAPGARSRPGSSYSASGSLSGHERAGEPGRRAAGDEPGRVDAPGEEGERGRQRQTRGRPVDDGRPPELPGDQRHERNGGCVGAVEEAGRRPGAAEPGNERVRQRDEDEGWQKDGGRGHEGAGDAGQEIADEGGGGEYRPRRHLA